MSRQIRLKNKYVRTVTPHSKQMQRVKLSSKF